MDQGVAPDTTSAVRLAPGPHLFIDDLLVAESRRITRRVNPPARVPENPLIPGISACGDRPGVGCSGNQVSACYDPETETHKMWTVVDMRHNPDVVQVLGRAAPRWTPVYHESGDGLQWSEPRLMPGLGGQHVLFDPDAAVPGERYKSTHFVAKTEGDPDRAMDVYFSGDGVHWQPFAENPALRLNNDIWAPAYDPLLRRYYIFMKPQAQQEWTDVHGTSISFNPRQTWISTSADFRAWTVPRPLFVPDSRDEGHTEWYAAYGGLRRGEHFIVFLLELRDDLRATRAPCDDTKPEGREGGIGYTVLAWTTDGERWQRDRYTDKFLAPDPDPTAWDHAHAWIGCAVPHGDELWLYHGGYKYGHKYYTDRSVGLATMKRDRFVAREAGPEGGTLLTPPVVLSGRRMTVNAKVNGDLRVRLIDEAGKAIPSFDAADHAPIRGDDVALPVEWESELTALAGKPARLEFELRDASLFAFDLIE